MPVALIVALTVIGLAWWILGRRMAGDSGAGSGRHPGRKRECRWAGTGDRKGRFEEYRCASCGVSAYSSTGNSPTICKRNLRG